MELILAGYRTTAALLERARTVLGAAAGRAPELHRGADGAAWILVVRDDANLVQVHTSPDATVVVAGSASSPGARRADDAATIDRARHGRLEPRPDELGLVARGDGLVAAAGPGAHRLYVSELDDGAVLVANGPRLLAGVVDPARPIDRRHEDVLLGFGFLPEPATPYRDVRVLPTGTVHRWGVADPPAAPPPTSTPSTAGPHPPGHSGAARHTDDGPAGEEAPTVASFDQAVDELHRRFLTTVEELAGDHDELAVLLGGLDSALVAATLVRLGRRVRTYTYSFGDPRFEQRDVAPMTRAIGVSERWVRITPEVMSDGLTHFADVFPQPGAQPHYQLHTLEGARRIRADGFDQVLTGDGCDAVFLGYPTVNRRARLMERLGSMPSAALTPVGAIAAAPAVERRLGHVARMARSTLGGAALPMPARGHLPTRYLDDVALGRLRRGPAPAQAESVPELRHRLAEGLEHLDPVRLAFHGNALTGQSRMKVEGSTTATGLRQYTPFTHPRVRDYVAALPVEYLRPPGAPAGAAGKALLVEMVRRHGMLSESVLAMPKQSPADSPIDGWYRGPLRGDLLALLEHLPFEWNRDYVEDLLRPKVAEDLYRHRVAISHNALQAVGLLASYASFHRR